MWVEKERIVSLFVTKEKTLRAGGGTMAIPVMQQEVEQVLRPLLVAMLMALGSGTSALSACLNQRSNCSKGEAAKSSRCKVSFRYSSRNADKSMPLLYHRPSPGASHLLHVAQKTPGLSPRSFFHIPTRIRTAVL